MGEKKGTTVLLTVIGIATLLVTLVGATFAFFTATVDDQNEGTNNVVITAANLGTITYSHGNQIVMDNIYPGATKNVDFSVESAAGTTADVDYEVWLVVEENTFTTDNLKATLTLPASNTTATLNNFPAGGSLKGFTTGNEYKIATATNKAVSTDTWNMSVVLTETNLPQNDDQGRVFRARIEVRVQGDGLTYSQQSVYTTTVAP